MKKSLLTLSIALLGFNALNAQVKLGNNPTTIDARSLLELESTDKAILLPRLSTTQRDAQIGWKAGMFIYNSTDSSMQVFDGMVWSNITKGKGNAWVTTGNAGTNANNFLGTSDNVALRIRTNNIERIKI